LKKFETKNQTKKDAEIWVLNWSLLGI
jgi:hypothetical protein